MHGERQTVTLPDGPAVLYRYPGTPEPGVVNDLLIAAARQEDPGAVFLTGPGLTATALWAARAGNAISIWTDSAAEANGLRDTFALHKLSPPEIHTEHDFAGLEVARYDRAFVHLARGRLIQAEQIALAAAVLKPGGRLIFAGAVQEGIKSALGEARRVFGSAGIVLRKAGVHAGMAERSTASEAAALPIPKRETIETVLAGQPAYVVSYTGVFASGRLDEGAAALIEGMRVANGDCVLDLGCGTGVVGLCAVRMGATVAFTDVSARAVAATRATLQVNAAAGSVWHCVGAEPIADRSIDVVLTNPPFHQGRGVDFEVARLFIDESARVLRPGGRLYLVANAFLPYESWLRSRFSQVGTVLLTPRFRVWHGLR